MTVALGQARHLILSLDNNGIAEGFQEFGCSGNQRSHEALPPGEDGCLGFQLPRRRLMSSCLTGPTFMYNP